MNFSAMSKQVHDMYNRQQGVPEIIVERDTSLSLSYGKDEQWNLPNSFLNFRWYQQEVHDAMFNKNMRFIYLAWCRRLGKEVTSWSALIKYCLINRCTGVIIYPDSKMGSRVLWEGKMTDKENKTTLDFLDFLPPIVDRVKDINHTVKRIDLPNGSQIWLLGAENFDKLRGINPQIAVFSEYAYQDPRAYDAIRPIIAENGGTIIVQTTFDGYNHGHRLYSLVKNDPNWYTSFYTAETARDLDGKRYVSEEEIQMMRNEGKAEHFIQQEFYMRVDGDVDKYIFGQTLQNMKKAGCLQKELWKPGHSISSFWDIGLEDANAIILVQVINGKPKIVKYFETNNKTYESEIEMITEWRTTRNLSLNKHFLPHDGKNRTKMTPGDKPKNAVSYISEKLGEPCIGVDKPSSKAYGTQLARAILPSCAIDEVECARLLECIGQHKKEYDDGKQCFLNSGVHDWTSHGVKAVQTMAIAFEMGLLNRATGKIGNYRKDV